MKYYYDLLDSYSKVKKRKLYLLEDLEQTDPDTFSKLQSAENTAKNLITNATEDWKPIPQMAGLEMKRSVSRSQINKGVVIKGLGHGWAHGIKVIDDNGMPVGSIQDLRSPWGRFVAKLIPELDPDNRPEEEGAGGAGAEEEMIGPDGQPIRPDYDVEQQTVARIKDIVCRSVEPLQSFLHRLKNKYDIIFYTSDKDVELVDDGERSVDTAFRSNIISLFDLYLDSNNKGDYKLVKLEGSVEERLETIKRTLANYSIDIKI